MEIELKTFQTIQMNFATMGCTPNQQQNNPNRKLNSAQIIIIVILAINTVTLSLYVLLVANDIEDYTDVIFSLTITVGVAMSFVSIIFKNDELFNTIELNEKEVTCHKCESE